MKSAFLLSVLITAFLVPSTAAGDPAIWSVSLEFPGGLFVEHRLAPTHFLAVHVWDMNRNHDADLPPARFRTRETTGELRYLFVSGDTNHHGEFGAALRYMDEDLRLLDNGARLSGHEVGLRYYAGYRYQPPAGGFQFRGGLSYYFDLADQDAHADLSEETLDFDRLLLPYFSLGWAF